MTLMFDSGMIMKEKLEASHSLGFKGYQGGHALMLNTDEKFLDILFKK